MEKSTLTFKECFMKYTKKDLTTIAKLHHMPRYSSLSKEELASQLQEFLLSPDRLYSFFLYLGSDELEALHSRHGVSDPVLLRRLQEGGYCFREEDGSFYIPQEVQEQLVFDKRFLKQQERYSFLVDCLYAAGSLYGCTPVSVLLTMYNRYADEKITHAQFIQLFQEIPEYFKPFTFEHDFCIYNPLYTDGLYKQIQKCQGLLPFYIPSKEDIVFLSRHGYFPEDSHRRKLSSVFHHSVGLSEYNASALSGKVQAIFRQGGAISDALRYLDKNYGIQPTNSSESLLLAALNEMFSHTRLLLSRGYTAAQTVHLKKNTAKIYPNSPCLCGSGKKYKNCCGRLR